VIVRALPPKAEALIFDFDGTLYTNAAYARYQEECQVARLARHLGIAEAEAIARLDAAREARRAAGLPKTSLARHFLSFGVDMDSIVRWRVEDIRPSEWIGPNPALDQTLATLARQFRLVLLTNNPREVGKAGVAALGVAARFEAVIGLDDTFESKPAPEPFLAAAAALGLPPSVCVSIGDRVDVDLEPALALGMGAILVDGVEDVYKLPDLLAR
jgi:phosphoglycolate phosphatase/putative hydrolase of the HAD superfamily